MHHEAFNADFFITAATVIPILYLALTLQGQTFESLINRLTTLWHRNGWQWSVLYGLTSTATFAIIAAGSLGEWLAIYAIYQQQADTFTTQIVRNLLLVLIVAVAAGPAWRVLSWSPSSSEPKADLEKTADQAQSNGPSDG